MQRLHKEQGVKRVLQAAAAPGRGPAETAEASPPLLLDLAPAHDLSPAEHERLQSALEELLEAQARLRRLIDRP